MWWRSYTPKNKPLTNRHPLRDRIANGDFEAGPYLMEVELVLHTMNEKYLASVTRGGEVDHNLYHQNTTIDRARRKRLLEDFEKDEKSKLQELKKSFTNYRWRLTGEQYESEVENFNGTLLEFYDYIEDKYGKP
jgi:hypothetical protein